MAKSFIFDKNSFNSNIGFGGWIKDINGVNGSPRSIAPGFPNLDDQMNQMGITHFRFHDNLGFGDLDNHFEKNDQESQFIPNLPQSTKNAALSLIADLGNTRTIFPNAAIGMREHNLALALSNANYTMTDKHVKKVMDNEPHLNPTNIQREIMFRVGRTNRGGRELPEDFDIYASLAKEVAKRYSANYRSIGLPRPVKYWEIWNEPDLTIFWNSNDPEQYYEFYAKVARAIKQASPNAKVGGAGVAGGYNPGGEYLDGLLAYCRKNNVPIDFLSWHHYANSTSDPQNIIDIGDQIQSSLSEYGYGNIESYCTEWNSTPFAHATIFSKLQSAKNASYIASALIYMNHTKVDKAYYYRGDASSFGLFNNEPGFCTYAAQAFHLYNKMFETPKLLKGSNDFGSGLATLAGVNAQGNKINILAANYEVDYRLSDESAPVESPMYKQHYIDGNRQIDQLTDSWSLEEWFGGVNPTNIKNNNAITPKQQVSQLPTKKNARARSRNYTQSRQGIDISIKNIDYRSYRVRAWRIQEGGQLWTMEAEDVSSSINLSIIDNDTLRIIDKGAVKSTVTLYSIESNANYPLPTLPEPDTEVSEWGVTTHIKSGKTPLTRLFLNKPLKVGRKYQLKFIFTLPVGIYLKECPEHLVFDGVTQQCISQNTGVTNDYTYDINTGELTIHSSNVSSSSGFGRTYLYVPNDANGNEVYHLFSYSLTELK